MAKEQTKYDKLLNQLKNNKFFVRLLVVVLVVGGIVSFGGDLGKIWRFIFPADKPVPDLVINSLLNETSVIPLDGYPVIDLNSEGKRVFTGGAHIRLNLSTDMSAENSISVHELRVNILGFDDKPDDRLAYTIDETKIHGEGFAEVQVFTISLDGDSLESYWIDNDKNPQKVNGNNLLNTEAPKVIRLSKFDDVSDIKISLSVGTTGLYEISFTFRYDVAGTTKEKTTDSVFLYMDED